MKRSLGFLVLSAVVLAACGDDEIRDDGKRDVTIHPSKPKGSVVGTIVDSYMNPLAGATVRASYDASIKSVVVGADGYFAFSNVPAGGPIGLAVEAEGYSSALLTTIIPNTAGDSPMSGASVHVGPIGLFPMTGSFTLDVVGSDGKPLEAVGAFCQVDVTWMDWTGGNPLPNGSLLVDAEVSAGKLSCSGLPSLADLSRLGRDILVIAPAIDVDGDGTMDYEGFSEHISAEDLFMDWHGSLVVNAWKSYRGVDLVGTNVQTLSGGHPFESIVSNTAGIEMVFENPVLVHFTGIRDDQDREDISHQVVVNGNRVEIRPEGAPWPKGQKMHLRVSVAPVGQPMHVWNFSGDFLTSSDQEVTVARASFVDTNADGELSTFETLDLVFSEAIGMPLHFAFAFVPVQVNFDLDGSGTIGDASCELGNVGSCQAQLSEWGDNFSRFASLSWNGPSVPAGTAVHVRFDLVKDPAFFSAAEKTLQKSVSKSLTAIDP